MSELVIAAMAACLVLCVFVPIIMVRRDLIRLNNISRLFKNPLAQTGTSEKLLSQVFFAGLLGGILLGAVAGLFIAFKPANGLTSFPSGRNDVSGVSRIENKTRDLGQSSQPGNDQSANTSHPNLNAIVGDSPMIQDITTNAGTYPDNQIPRYEKFEITFQLDTVAQNLQLPFDSAPPPGIEPGIGVSVEALFTPDNWQTVYKQPAFYYQDFQDEPKKDQEWLYPTENFAWKVRFSPNEAGAWQYKLTAQDAGGIFETEPFTFTVTASANKGFIRVSQADPRYFEFDDGSYFPALGYNLAVATNQDSFQIMSENGIQLIRTWLPSQFSIFGAAWSPWRSVSPLPQPQEPNARLRYDAAPPFNLAPAVDPPIARPESEVFLWLSHDETKLKDGLQWNFIPCAVLGWNTPPLPVKPKTGYRVRVRYKEQGLNGPKVQGEPYGFTVKTGGWLWHRSNESRRCYYPNTGKLLAATYSTTNNWSHYPDPDHPGWQILEGTFTTGNDYFLDKFYLAIENAASGNVFIDYVWLEEDLGNGQYGPNVIYKPWMAHHLYFDQRNSYAFDKVLDLAKQYDIYLKLVILDKNDYVLNIFEPDGTFSTRQQRRAEKQLFFGQGRETAGKTKIRWLQEAWWRYLQARWGYSTNIHSWELLNEGDPSSTLHYILADEFGKYFRQAFIPNGQTTKHPNMHLVTTSFWNHFPDAFWGNADYPYVDYADIHYYGRESTTEPLESIYDLSDFYDAALFSQKLSMHYGAKQPQGPGKPVMRGEVGFIFNGPDFFAEDATGGVWLHNFIWAGINSGGLIESYWTGAPTQAHIYRKGFHDYRPMFKSFYNFISNIPLNNGRYQEINAVSSQPDLRVWGQQDTAQGQAHFWIQNKNHTWKQVLDGAALPAASGTITISGFQPGKSYTVEWWDPYQPDPDRQVIGEETVVAQNDGSIAITVENLTTDVAAKILSGR